MEGRGDKLTRFGYAERVRPLRLSINACTMDRKVSLRKLAAFTYAWPIVLRSSTAVRYEGCCRDVDNEEEEEEDSVPR
jgi:hypothetical protein